MESERQKKYKKLSTLFKTATKKPVCKLCFNEFSPVSFGNFISQPCLCDKCQKQLKRIFHSYRIGDIKVFAIYEYTSPFSRYIFQYKENLDIELAPIFLEGINTYLWLKFLFYNIVFMPSSQENMERRGFDAIKLIFQKIHLPIIDNLLFKKDNVDQKNLSGKKRREHIDFIGLNEKIDIGQKNILLIDDVISTGTSILQAVKVLKKGEPRRIRVLVLSENK